MVNSTPRVRLPSALGVAFMAPTVWKPQGPGELAWGRQHLDTVLKRSPAHTKMLGTLGIESQLRTRDPGRVQFPGLDRERACLLHTHQGTGPFLMPSRQ